MDAAPRALEAKPTEDYRVWVRFEDGLTAEIDFSDLVESGGFYGLPLRNPEFFRQVEIYPGGSGIFWPNEADVCPDTLYQRAQEAAGVAA
jgi:Protein of unknown function (DUF2442)